MTTELVRQMAYDATAKALVVTMWWPQAGTLTLWDGAKWISEIRYDQRYTDWCLPVASDPAQMRLTFKGRAMRTEVAIPVSLGAHD